MIEQVVSPLTSRSLAEPPIVERLTADYADTDRSDEDHIVDQEEVLGGSDHQALHLVLPGFIMEELRWVADQEGRDMQEIVVNAVDEFLADHWVRSPET